MSLIVHAKHLYTDWVEHCDVEVVVENGVIVSVGPPVLHPARTDVVQCEVLTAGLVDIHCHGYGGADNVYRYWQQPEHTQQVCARHGTTSVLATLVFENGAEALTADIVRRVQEAVGDTSGPGAVIEGIHAEGPVVADCGGLPRSETDMPLADFERLLDSMPALRVMTIAPAADATTDFACVRALARRGVRVSLGHDRGCTEEHILGAMRAAAPAVTHITHLFNVCSFCHREGSLVNFGLLRRLPALPQYQDVPLPSVEIIADGVHVGALALQLVLDAHDRIACISDAILESGSGAEPQGEVRYGERVLEARAGGVYLGGTSTLAGSCLTLDAALRRLINVHGVLPERAVSFLTCVPAGVAGLQDVGSVRVGMRGSLTMWDDLWNVQRTYVAGRCVHKTQ